MGLRWTDWPPEVLALLRKGVVIPAHPLVLNAARKLHSYLHNGGDAKSFAEAARRMVFLKGRDSHDYKFSSAVLEDYAQMAPTVRDRFLAASVFYLKGSADRDNDTVARTRAAIG